MKTVDDLIQQRPRFTAMKPAQAEHAIQISPSIWMSSGTSNAYMVTTNAGRVIINTGMGFEALTHKKAFDAVCANQTAFIVLTQGHVDHVGGVKTFREKNTIVIAQKNNPVCQKDDARIQNIRSSQAYIWFQPTIDKAIEVAKKNPEALVQDKPVPDILFDDHYIFHCGQTQFELLATPGGETIDSCAVWIPETKVLFSGNLFGPLFPHFPNINTLRGDKYRYLEPYLDSLARVRALNPEMLITGHFDPIQGSRLIRDSLNRLEAAVRYVHDETLKGMNVGKHIFTLMNEIHLPASLQVGEGYGKISWAVRTIWESYMGWFKARQTSELYPTQNISTCSELVALAGIEPVLNKINSLLLANELQKALPLCEAVLAHSPDNKMAINLSIQVHQKLLAQAQPENFWESGWLKSQIITLQKQSTKIP